MDGAPLTQTRQINMILLGPPGAGKGTQAELLVDALGLVQLSTGDMLRAAKQSGTEMGKRVAEVMDRGELVTDEIVIGLIEERLGAPDAKGFIFDGFPRTIAQADALADLLAKTGKSLDLVIEMQVEDAFLVERILNRAAEARAAGKPVRADDNAETLTSRLAQYHAQTAPLIEYYRGKGVLVAVDAMAEIADVQSEMAEVIGKIGA